MLRKPSLNSLFTNIYAGGALSTLIRNDEWPYSHSLSLLYKTCFGKIHFSSHNAEFCWILHII